MLIDLQSFCSPSRPDANAPFTIGEFTYATDGLIALRVPAVSSARDGGPALIAKAFEDVDDLEFVSVPVVNLPPAGLSLAVRCDECIGTGKVHDCPDCQCKCETCNGESTVSVDADQNTSVEFRGLNYGVAIFRRVLPLPGLQWERFLRHDTPTRFSFDGGVGLLMPLIGTYSNHIKLGATP
jgi:hypothetical protein